MIAEWIRGRRNRLNLRVGELAEMVGVAEDEILAWESGAEEPDFHVLARLAERLRDPQTIPGVLFTSSYGEETGVLVVSEDNDSGIGVVVESTPITTTVAYSVSLQNDLVPEVVSTASLHRVHLSPQTRVYVPSEDGSWRAGRIGYHDAVARMCGVELPDRGVAEVDEKDLRVRAKSVPCDPVDVLAAKAHETAFFHNHRHNLVRTLVRHRALSQGLSGLVSSRVDLHEHQVGVIQRVTRDPIQRYLLADEVGLGKTIEACAIARQHLIDSPRGSVLVVVPSGLAKQWSGEWRQKFALFLHDPRINFVESSALPLNSTPTMLIVDEAHHAADWAWSDEVRDAERWQDLARMADRSEAVLLLSATPASYDTDSYLALLRLLDPGAYRLEDRHLFATRVEMQESLGRKLLALDENLPGFLLAKPLEDLLEMLGDDAELQARGENLKEQLAAGSEDVSREVQDLRTWVSESYRLHRRMLRSRRADSSAISLGRSEDRVREEWSTDGRESEVADAIEQWRLDVCAAGCSDDYAHLYRLFLESASEGLDRLAEVINMRLGRSSLPSDVRQQDSVALGLPVLDCERGSLSAMLEITEQEVLADELTKEDMAAFALKRPASRGESSVVFVSHATQGRSVADGLRRHLGSEMVFLRLEGMTEDEVDIELSAFRRCSGGVLVCDRSGEEGLNLQSSTHAFLLDVPFEPNRLEQRMGRLDRIGRKVPLNTIVFAGPEPTTDEPTPMEAWVTVLRDGLGFFSRSIAPLQLLIPRLVDDVVQWLFREGTATLRDRVERVREEVEREEHRIAAQDLLDSTDTVADAAETRSGLEEDDRFAPELEQAAETWLGQVLQFKVHRSHQGRTHRPAVSTLVPADVLLNGFLPLAVRPITYSRAQASSSGAVELARAGHPLVEELQESLAWDDRGRAAAVLRRMPAGISTGDVWVGMKIDWTVEAELARAIDVVGRNSATQAQVSALRRRADALLPPILMQSVVRLDGSEEDEPKLRRTVLKPFDTTFDRNLHKDRMHVLDEFVAATQWRKVVKSVVIQAEERVRSGAELARRIELALIGLEEDRERRLAILKARARIRDESDELALEKALIEAIEEGIRRPVIRAEAAVFMVLAEEFEGLL